MRKPALIAFVVALIAVVAFEVVPWLGRERDFPAEIPNPPALQAISLDVVKGGQTICIKKIAAETHSREARFTVGTYKKPGPELELRVSAPGYRAVAHQPAGYADNSTLRLRIGPPPRAMLVTACIANRGTTKIALYAADDRARSRAAVDVDGKRVSATPALGFWEGREVSIGDRAGVTVERMATFRGFLGHTWLLWTLLALFCVGTPVALGLALWRGMDR
jgi:hypothetical protein